jgi:hypothetical protein
MVLGRRGKLQTETNGGLGNCQQMHHYVGGGDPQYLHFLLCSTEENSSDLNSMAGGIIFKPILQERFVLEQTQAYIIYEACLESKDTSRVGG